MGLLNALQGEASAEKVVLKKLGHDAELQLLDRNICTVSGQSPDHCHPAHYIKFLSESFTLRRANEKTLDFEEIGRYDWTEALACMRSQRLVDLLVRRAHYHPAAPTVDNLGSVPTVPSLITIRISLFRFATTVEHSEKCAISSQFAF